MATRFYQTQQRPISVFYYEKEINCKLKKKHAKKNEIWGFSINY